MIQQLTQLQRELSELTLSSMAASHTLGRVLDGQTGIKSFTVAMSVFADKLEKMQGTTRKIIEEIDNAE